MIVALVLLLFVITTDTPKYYLICEDEQKAKVACKKIYMGEIDQIIEYISSTI